MKVVRQICCGMDVHKNIVVATILKSNQDRVPSFIQRSFSTLNNELIQLREWLLENHCTQACMESTGKYWIPIFNILESDIEVFLTHPKYVKAIKGKKTDKKDSKWIAELFMYDLIKFSFIPPKLIRELREISRYRFKLVSQRSAEKNRYQNSMTVSNIGLASVFTDPFGKSSQSIMQELIQFNTIDDIKLRKLIHGNTKNKSEKIIDAIKHSNIESDKRFKLKTTSAHILQLDQHIENCEVEIANRCQPFLDQIVHLTTIPGMTIMSVIMVISEIGLDMNQFESDKQLTCWAGLAPANNESAGKKKSSRISKAGKYLKPLMVQLSLAAIKSKDNPYFSIKYNRIKKRRGHKKAIITIARMMLVSIYHMIKSGEVFNPCDYDSLVNKQPHSCKQYPLTVESALQFLQQSGIDISTLSVPSY